MKSEEYELENERDSRLQEYASRFPSKVYVLDHVTIKPFDRVETRWEDLVAKLAFDIVVPVSVEPIEELTS